MFEVAIAASVSSIVALYHAFRSHMAVRKTDVVPVQCISNIGEGEMVVAKIDVPNSHTRDGWRLALNDVFPKSADTTVCALVEVEFTRTESTPSILPLMVTSPAMFLLMDEEEQKTVHTERLWVGDATLGLGQYLGDFDRTTFLPGHWGFLKSSRIDVKFAQEFLSRIGRQIRPVTADSASITVRFMNSRNQVYSLGYRQGSKFRPILTGPSSIAVLRKYNTPGLFSVYGLSLALLALVTIKM